MGSVLNEQALYTAAQTRELDRIAIEVEGIPGFTLMTAAGAAAFADLSGTWPWARTVQVFCGTGNNGGDGFIVAALAREAGLAATVYQVGAADKISGDALLARQRAEAAGVSFLDVADFVAAQGVLVDALLGTGLAGGPREDYAAAIALINGSGAPVLALDIPSGLCSDSGCSLGATVQASRTVTFIGIKRGLVTGAGPEFVGELRYASLDVPGSVFAAVPANVFARDLPACLEMLPRRRRDAHKGSYGHVLVAGGDRGMGGAALMAAEAAGRCGAGLVSAATRPEYTAAFASRRPEVMAHGINSGLELQPLLSRATVIAIGPGLGQAPWAEQLLQQVLATDLSLVIDADALNLLADRVSAASRRRDNWVLTPHPGEAARLLGTTTAEVQADRFGAVQELQHRFGGVALLKGPGTLVCGGEQVFVCSGGNPGMASGGMGDVLTGVVSGLLAQGLAALDAACLGVCLHARAGDLAAVEGGERGVLATDLMPYLRGLLDG